MISKIWDWIRARLLAFVSGVGFVEVSNGLGMTPVELVVKIFGG